jgi:tellurite resistance protein
MAVLGLPSSVGEQIMRFMVTIALGAFVAACATSAPSDGNATASAAEKKTCKRTMVMGSNVPKNVCHTEEEWAAINKQGREDVEEFDRARREVTTTGIGQ